MGKRDLLKKNREHILRIARLHGAYNIRLFGFLARGDADDLSDIDLLVDMESGRSLLDLGGLWSDLNSLLRVKVDVVTERGLKKRIRERVLGEAAPF
jgi:predicted nucleotidyltransferase